MPDYNFDTTVLSNFAVVGKSKLLTKSYSGKAYTTVQVINELRKCVKEGYSFLESILHGIEISGPRIRFAV